MRRFLNAFFLFPLSLYEVYVVSAAPTEVQEKIYDQYDFNFFFQ